MGALLQLITQRGQAVTELLVALPLIGLIALAGAQLVVVGSDWWLLSEIARVSAREVAVTRARDGDLAARRVAARVINRFDADVGTAPRSRVSVDGDGTVVLRRRLRLVGPLAAAIGSERAPVLTARSRFAP